MTLQAQREYPPDMQCKDKFLLQSTIVSLNTDVDDLPQDTVSFFTFMQILLFAIWIRMLSFLNATNVGRMLLTFYAV